MSRHTPGPWAIGFGDGTGCGFPDREGGFYITAAALPPRNDRTPRVTSGLPFCVVTGCSDDWGIHQGVQRLEDAVLIEQAPAMLALLQKLAGYADSKVTLAELIMEAQPIIAAATRKEI